MAPVRPTRGVECPYEVSGHGPVHGPVDLGLLTQREKQVLLLLGAGLSNNELSHRLGISERTVKAHITRILEKLGQNSRLQAAMISVLNHRELCPSPECHRTHANLTDGLGTASAA